jgi:4-hydroxybenzoate polyprenyltransferase
MKGPLHFLSRWRPFPVYELVSYVLMYASMPMLAYGIQTYDAGIILTIMMVIVTLYAGFFAALIWNDITDADVDQVAHPTRPVPSGRISKPRFFSVALIFSALTFVFALLLSFWCLALVGIAALFVTFHDKYLKRKIRFPAYSEIFTPIQWVIVPLFGYLAIWMTYPLMSTRTIKLFVFPPLYLNGAEFLSVILLFFFTYFAVNAHDLPEGIHDVEGDKKQGVRTYATSFGEKTAAKISFGMFILSGILAIGLVGIHTLSVFFLLPFLCIWVYTLYYSYRLMNSDGTMMKTLSALVGRKGYDYFLVSYDLIFLDIFIRVLLFHYFSIVM